MSQGFKWLSSLLLLSMVLAACSTAAPACGTCCRTDRAAPAEAAPVATEAPTEAAARSRPNRSAAAEAVAPAATGAAVFFSTQFVPVEEQEKFRALLKEGGFDFTGLKKGRCWTSFRLAPRPANPRSTSSAPCMAPSRPWRARMRW